MNRSELKEYFKIYLDQVPVLVESKAYWALLHYIIIFPDICAGLESLKGSTSSKAYKSWAKKYLATANFTEEDWYRIRCKLLHQGQTEEFSFSQPTANGIIFHRNRHSDGSFNLDIGELTKEVLAGLEKWFDDIVAKPKSEFARNVEKNILSLAQPRDDQRPFGNDIAGVSASVSASPRRVD